MGLIGVEWNGIRREATFFLITSPHETFFLVLDCASAGNKNYLNIYFLDLYPPFCSGA